MKGSCFTVALAGNPNVGKSTLFNALTRMHRHTGNWPGKSVDGAYGSFRHGECEITLVDVPGAYSLNARSPDEQIAFDYISGKLCDKNRRPPDAAVVVCDACSLCRSLRFAAQIAELGLPYILCINLADEAARRGIKIDCARLERLTGVPCVMCSARDGGGLELLKRRLCALLKGELVSADVAPLSPEELYGSCVNCPPTYDRREYAVDRLLTSRLIGLPLCALLLAIVFFITVWGSAPLSDALELVLSRLLLAADAAARRLGVPPVLRDALCGGVLGVSARVCAVMLPPMAIFFPLFTLLEDLGLLPRIAFIFDRAFASCGACGKQALTVMMGLGCNAVGITGCRIIDSPRERLIAMLTNSFTPCNGRLAVIISLASALSYLSGRGGRLTVALTVCGAVLLGFALTLALSRLLSVTALSGNGTPFTLELPPYRVPKLGELIVRSVLDRSIFVLGRAICAAAPAGLAIWLLSNISCGERSLFSHLTSVLEPLGRAFGMDGVMLCAFILALPAAELTVPLMIAGYMNSPVPGSEAAVSLGATLAGSGIGCRAVLCAVIFTLSHFPCSTALLTVRRESGSCTVTLLAALLPSVVGLLLCLAVNAGTEVVRQLTLLL